MSYLSPLTPDSFSPELIFILFILTHSFYHYFEKLIISFFHRISFNGLVYNLIKSIPVVYHCSVFTFTYLPQTMIDIYARIIIRHKKWYYCAID